MIRFVSDTGRNDEDRLGRREPGVIEISWENSWNSVGQRSCCELKQWKWKEFEEIFRDGLGNQLNERM